MTRFFTTAICCFLLMAPLFTFAQKSQVTNATIYEREGDFDKARKAIEAAVKHPKTAEDAKTWYTAGKIYERILTKQQEENSKKAEADRDPIDGQLVMDMHNAYKKAMSLDKKDGYYAKNAEQRLPVVWMMSLNKGVELYGKDKFTDAVPYYKLASELKPADTSAYVYMAYNADGLQDPAAMEMALNKLEELKFEDKGKKQVYFLRRLAAMSGQKGDYDKALMYIGKARKMDPNNKDAAIQELGIYFDSGKTGELKSKLNEAIN